MDLVRPFPKLTDDQRVQVGGIAQEQTYPHGDIVIEQGMVLDALYVIETGSLRVLQRRSDTINAEFTGPLGPGDLFGEMSFVDQRPTSAVIVADGDVSALRIVNDELREIMSRDPVLEANIYHSMLAVVARRLRSTNMRVVTPVDFE